MHAERNVCRGERLPRHLDLAHSPRGATACNNETQDPSFLSFTGLSGVNPPWTDLQVRTSNVNKEPDESDMRSALEDRKFSGKFLILNEDREVGEWRKSIRVLFQRFFYELVIVTIWKVGHERNINVFLSRIKIFERGRNQSIIRIKY